MKKLKIVMLIVCFMLYSSPALPAALTSGGILYGLTGTSATNESALTWSSTNKNITLTQGTITASYPVLDMSSTWNGAAVAFTGINYAVTSTASSAASVPIKISVDGTTIFQVRKDGQIGAASLKIPASGSAAGTGNVDLITRAGGVFFHHDYDKGNIGIGMNTAIKDPSGGGNNIFIGDSAGDSDSETVDCENNVVIGSYGLKSVTSGNNNVALGGVVGYGLTSGTNNMMLGYGAGYSLTTGNYNILISSDVSSGSITSSIGMKASVTANNQMVIGGSGTSLAITDVYIGEGVTEASPLGFTLNATGGSGTNVAGASITLAGGKGTGSANPGSVYFATSTVGSSGSTLQSLVNRWQVDGPNGGHLIAYNDNSYDFGASGANRPRTVYAGTSVVSPVFKTTTALVTAGSSGTPAFTANMIGGSGPTTAAQNGWVKMQDSAGATIWIPVWK